MQSLLFAAALAATQGLSVGAPSSIARAYFMDAHKSYRTAAYAEGTNSVIRRYSREDPFGVDAKYDQPDLARRQIPDEPTFWGLKGLRNVRDIGGWTGLKPGMVYRGSLMSAADADRKGPENLRMPLTKRSYWARTRMRAPIQLRLPGAVGTKSGRRVAPSFRRRTS